MKPENYITQKQMINNDDIVYTNEGNNVFLGYIATTVAIECKTVPFELHKRYKYKHDFIIPIYICKSLKTLSTVYGDSDSHKHLKVFKAISFNKSSSNSDYDICDEFELVEELSFDESADYYKNRYKFIQNQNDLDYAISTSYKQLSVNKFMDTFCKCGYSKDFSKRILMDATEYMHKLTDYMDYTYDKLLKIMNTVLDLDKSDDDIDIKACTITHIAIGR